MVLPKGLTNSTIPKTETFVHKKAYVFVQKDGIVVNIKNQAVFWIQTSGFKKMYLQPYVFSLLK